MDKEKQQAISQFEAGDYESAFKSFVELYHKSEDISEHNMIFQILLEAFYAPNEEELRERYDQNVRILKSYPYFWEKSFRKYADLSFQLFPISNKQFFIFDKESGCFISEYEPMAKKQDLYFFEHLDKPLQIEDHDNFYNLKFLNDCVRASEDFAGDNHIYLMYSSIEPLERLMLTCDLQTILEQEKFVFLTGKENWGKYPIDFQKEFRVDYSKIEPTPIRIEEIKRFCLWYARAFSGTIMCHAALGMNSGIQVYFGHHFNLHSSVKGKSLFYSNEFQEALSKIDSCYTPAQLIAMMKSGKYSFQEEKEDFMDFLRWLAEKRSAASNYTVRELFVGYFLYHYEKRKLNPRITPVLVFDPHMGNPSCYYPLMFSFPYHSVLTCVREPVMMFARFLEYSNLCIGWDAKRILLWLGQDYHHPMFLTSALLEEYFYIRFEDMKTRPEAVCRALCKHLNVPYEAQMLEADGSFSDAEGNTVKGFDTKPLHRDISAIVSEFDQLRLKILYDPILRYYGYPAFPFEEHPLTDKTIQELFRYPFRLEYLTEKRSKGAVPQSFTHNWVHAGLLSLWKHSEKIHFPQKIPLEELSNE